MSFLLDPPLLISSGAALEALTDDEATLRTADRAVLATFLGISVGLYLDLPGLGAVWKPFRAECGRDWMLNSGVFHFDHRNPSWKTHAVSVGIFATYPVWLRAGHVLGRKLRARRTSRLPSPVAREGGGADAS